MLHVYPAPRENVCSGLAHEEAQGPAVNSHSTGFTAIDEFYVLALIDFELQALRDVVYLCRDYRVGCLKFEIGQHLKQGSPLGVFPVGAGVLAIDLQHIWSGLFGEYD